ncbi:uncharacterized protein LOC110950546 isoform X2 [Acanthochromis polyacanthus]|nr:uncharacterized protein LOC110950546 isoform X2 [Acanthochromis polyacanthus]
MKQRLKKKLQRFDERRKEWVVGRKKNHNVASIKDEAIIMLEKLHAVGYKPMLVLGMKKKEHTKCEILTPRCSLTAFAKDCLQKIGSFYEYLCEGWTQEPIGGEEEITLLLTPCDPLEGTSMQQEHERNRVGKMTETDVTRDEPTPMKVEEEEKPIEGQMEWANTVDGQPDRTNTSGEHLEKVEEQVDTVEDTVERQVDAVEGQAVSSGATLNLGQKRKNSVATRHILERKKLQKDCSYHTHLESFPIKAIKKERVRKGETEILVEWEPCPVCGKEWAYSWQPKDSLQNTS